MTLLDDSGTSTGVWMHESSTCFQLYACMLSWSQLAFPYWHRHKWLSNGCTYHASESTGGILFSPQIESSSTQLATLRLKKNYFQLSLKCFANSAQCYMAVISPFTRTSSHISLTYSKLNTQRVLATAHQRLWPQVYVSKGDNNNLTEFLSRLPIAEGKETPGPYAGPAQGHQKWRNRTRLTRCLSWTNVLDPLTLVNIIPQ